jgi:signal transduction histidine kinase
MPPSLTYSPLAGVARRGLAAIRLSLGLDDAQIARVRKHADVIRRHVPQWVEGFYRQLLLDPVAQGLLADDGRVVRLKRSLTGWFDEMLSVPLDETYEKTRAAIGVAHMRIEMPPYLMVTGMSHLRSTVIETLAEDDELSLALPPPVLSILSRMLDMELALMLEAYRRHDRQRRRETDRSVYAERALRNIAMNRRDRVDAALCYAELALEQTDGEAHTHMLKLRAILRDLGLPHANMPVAHMPSDMVPHVVDVRSLCQRALDNVELDAATRVTITCPQDLRVRVHDEPLRLGIEELLQNAANHGGGGNIHVVVTVLSVPRTFSIEVHDEGPGWTWLPDGQRMEIGGMRLGLAFCELVAELHAGNLEMFTSTTGGAGVRLALQALPNEQAI